MPRPAVKRKTRRGKDYKKYRRVTRYVKKTNLARGIIGQAPVHHFKRTVRYTKYELDNQLHALYNLQFAMTNLDVTTNYTNSIAQMYEQYRLNKVVVRLIPRFSATELAQTNIQMPNIYSAIDHNMQPGDVIDLDTIQQFSNCKMHRGNKMVVITLTPNINIPITATQQQAGYKKWLSTSDMTTVHDGLHLYTPTLRNQDDTVTVAPHPKVIWDVDYIFYFSCKGLK